MLSLLATKLYVKPGNERAPWIHHSEDIVKAFSNLGTKFNNFGTEKWIWSGFILTSVTVKYNLQLFIFRCLCDRLSNSSCIFRTIIFFDVFSILCASIPFFSSVVGLMEWQLKILTVVLSGSHYKKLCMEFSSIGSY